MPGLRHGDPAKRGLQQDDLHQLRRLLLLPVRRPACAAAHRSAAGLSHCCLQIPAQLSHCKAKSLQLYQSLHASGL